MSGDQERNAAAKADQADDVNVGQVPAGGMGADSGAAEAVGIDPDSQSEEKNISATNDIPGVGTKAADGGMRSDNE